MGVNYLTLARAGAYVTGDDPSPATAKWARRRLLPYIPHYEIPGSGTVFKVSDIDAYLERHRKDPVDVDAIVAQVVGQHGRKRRD